MHCIELLERGIKQLEQEKGQLIAEKSALVSRIHVLELALARMVKGQERPPERDPVLGPELPNGEGTRPGLTMSEIEQGREPPPTCEPTAPGDGVLHPSCEFFVKSWRKTDQVLVEKCSLTGKGCYCEGLAYLSCTRRTFALDYEARQKAQTSGLPLPSKLNVVCSEDSPKPPLPGS